MTRHRPIHSRAHIHATLHRLHKWLHLGYLAGIVLDQHLAHVYTAGALLSIGTVMVLVGEPIVET